jgi:phosphotransacetylase
MDESKGNYPMKRKRVKQSPAVLKQTNVLKQTKGSPLYHRLISLKNNLPAITTAVVHPVDKLSLQGAVASAKAGLINAILVGPENKIRAVAKENKIDLTPYQIINTRHSHEAAQKAVELARAGKVKAIMKGKIHTDELMEAVLDKEHGLRTGRRMSHVFVMDVPHYPKPLFITDAALNLFPHLTEKVDIVQNAINLFHAIGWGTPKVAIVSAIETVNEKIPSTLDATALCKMAERGQITGGILDGPLAFDNAVSAESAKVKGIHSAVAGNADIIVVPDVESGNMLYKQMTYLSGMEAAGIVLGATVPIILTSRGSDELSRKASCALALLYIRNGKKIKRHKND